MNKYYNKIMNKLEVTPEMKQRILKNIQTNNRTYRSSKVLKYLSMVACLTLVVSVGAYVYSKQNSISQVDEDNTQIACGIEEVSNTDELSEKVGFEVQDLKYVPFEPTQVIYSSYWNELSQIVYVGENQEITYRKSKGNEDISGCYYDYDQIVQETINEIDYTINSYNGAFIVVTWYDSNEDFSYSLYFENGLTLEEVESLLQAI